MANSSYLTNNFKANMILAIPTLICVWTFLPGRSSEDYIYFLLIYILASRFYNPDLDHRVNRPGMLHFPLGKKTMEFLMRLSNQGGILRVLEIIIQIQKVITKIWYFTWLPLSLLITHRGILHWPIIGVIVRNLYIVAVIFVLNVFLLSLGIKGLEQPLNFIIAISELFLSFDLNSRLFFCLSLPVYIADINHSAVDAFDSLRNGRRFCPAGDDAIPPGLIYRIFKIKI